MSPIYIALIIIGSAIALVFIIVMLYLFVFRKEKLKKQITELDHKFEYLHALLIGQDAQYVKRLEIISRTNLLYVDIQTNFVKRFKEIRDKQDAMSQGAINNLKDLLDDKKYKALKTAIVDTRELVAAYEKEVNSLNSDLLAVVRPEEECRQSALVLKEQLRRIKQEYYSKQGDLSLVSDSFEEVFKLLDTRFEEFESMIESAHYEDASAILPNVEKIINELYEAVNVLPSYCISITSIIPDKIASLENAYENMVQNKYSLSHLAVPAAIREMNEDLRSITKLVKSFELKHVGNYLDDITSRIDELLLSFNEEKTAREKFEKENEDVYRLVNDIDRRYIKLCNTIPEVRKIYQINESYSSKINEIQNSINIEGAFKRSLDTFIHSATKQPYSVLLGKMEELKSASDKALAEMDEFQEYIDSLKIDSEEAFSYIYEVYERIKISEIYIHEINVDSTREKYGPYIEKAYDLSNEIFGLLNSLPIDMEQIKIDIKELKDIDAKYFGKNGEIKKDMNMMTLAENTIVYANRDRANLSDINQLVNQAEEHFNRGEFERAYASSKEAMGHKL